MLPLLAFVCLFSVSLGLTLNQVQQQATSQFPPTRQTQQHTHDPTIIRVGGEFYLYNVGEHIYIHTAKTMVGPWKLAGTVLNANSVIDKGDRAVPWAPNVIAVNGIYYCYYCVSRAGCRDSAIGVATSRSPGPGHWIDHGVVVQTGTGNGSGIAPYNESNAIDPSVLITADGAYLTFGSYWTGIWQVPLSQDLLSPASSTEPDERHLAYEPIAISKPNKNANSMCGDPTGAHAIEGAFISYRDGYYYLWFSHGRCCNLNPDRLPPRGQEYVCHHHGWPGADFFYLDTAFVSDGPPTRAGRSWTCLAKILSTAAEPPSTVPTEKPTHPVGRALSIWMVPTFSTTTTVRPIPPDLAV